MINDVQIGGSPTDSATSASHAFGSNVTAGNLLVIEVSAFKPSNDAFTVSDISKSAGTATLGAFSLDVSNNFNASGSDYINTAVFTCLVTGTGSCTINVGGAPAGSFFNVAVLELSSSVGWGASRLESSNTATGATGASSSGNAASTGAAVFIGGLSTYTNTTTAHTQDAAFSLMDEEEDVAHMTGAGIFRIVNSAETDAASWTAPTTFPWSAVVAVYKENAVTRPMFRGA